MFDKTYGEVPLKKVKIEDVFWSKYVNLIETVAIPYQWDALNNRIKDAEPSCCIENFKIAAKEREGSFHGFVFQDTDLAKWLEAIAYMLEIHPNEQWEKIADETIDLIERAQEENGYLNTYFTINEPEGKWTNLRECHELYTAGHLIEAATAYYKATGKEKILQVVCRLADHIDETFGKEEGKIQGYDGHQEIELALVKLYEVTGEKRYLILSQYFIDQRGQEPNFFDIESEKRGHTKHFEGDFMYKNTYNQTHLPVRLQTEAVGHAVRAVYMYSAMADLANKLKDQELLDSCRILWKNIVTKKLYITGSIGSTSYGEAFTFDYDLPNDTNYSETCASIGLIFFAHRMLKIESIAMYADEMERALYNTVLSGMSMDGKSFFYVNPLEVWPEACEHSPIKSHVKAERQKWFGCACCPPNVARLLMSIGSYIYTVSDNELFTQLYISGRVDVVFEGHPVRIIQKSHYPWSGTINFEFETEGSKEFAFALRIPGWCKNHSIKVNNELVEVSIINGFAMIHRLWSNQDTVRLELDMPVEIMQSNPLVRENAGKVAIQRGPLIYCLEEKDHGDNLNAIILSKASNLTAEFNEHLLGGIIEIKGKGYTVVKSEDNQPLYTTYKYKEKEMDIKAIPYCMWGNREPGEMLTWIRYSN